MPSLITIGLLIIASGLVITLVSSLHSKGLQSLGFLLVVGLNIAVTALALRQPEAIGPWHFVALAGFCVLVVVPGVLKRLTRRALSRGRPEQALSLLQLRQMFQPGSGLGREVAVLRGLVALRRGLPPDEELLEMGPEQLRLEPDFHLALVEQLMILCVLNRRWDDVLRLYRQEGDQGLCLASPGICCGVVRAFCEQGQLTQASEAMGWMLQHLQRNPSPEVVALYRQAQLVYLTHAGQVDRVQALFDLGAGVWEGFPRGGRRVWLGVARARSGDLEAARTLWRSVIDEAEDDEDPVAAEAALLLDDPPAPLGPNDDQEAVDALLPQMEGAVAAAVGGGARTGLRATPLTYITAGILVLVHLALELSGGSESLWGLQRFGGNFVAATLDGEPWRLVTSMFLHGSWLHLLTNVYALYVVGRLVERLYGSTRFWLIYLVAGICGSLASALTGEPARLSVGASGVVFGLLAASLVGIIQLRGALPDSWRRHALINMLVVLGLNLAIGYSLPRVDNAAHLGGLAGGAAVAVILVALARLGPPGLGRIAVPSLSAALAVGALVCGVMAAVTSPTDTLARIQPRTYARAGVSLQGPRHWIRLDNGATARQLFLGDPLVPTFGMPTVMLMGLESSGDPLEREARTNTRELAEEMARHKGVRSAKPLPLDAGADHGDTVRTEVDITLTNGARLRLVNLFKRHETLLLAATIQLTVEALPHYQQVISRMASTLRYGATPAAAAQSKVTVPGT